MVGIRRDRISMDNMCTCTRLISYQTGVSMRVHLYLSNFSLTRVCVCVCVCDHETDVSEIKRILSIFLCTFVQLYIYGPIFFLYAVSMLELH